MMPEEQDSPQNEIRGSLVKKLKVGQADVALPKEKRPCSLLSMAAFFVSLVVEGFGVASR